MPDAKTRFVLKRLNWYEHWQRGLTRTPGEVAVASFDTFEAADAERDARETARRKGLNPFTCGPAVQYWSHLDEPRLRDWLNDRGIDPPPESVAWADWWKKVHKKLSDTKRAAVWEACDKVRFFVVREEPVRPVGYAVVGINWEYNDETYDADAEGGHLLSVYRTRERAEQRCAELNTTERGRWGDFGGDEIEPDDEEYDMALFDMQDRVRRARGLGPDDKLGKNEGLYNNVAQVPFFEVIEVELEGLE
jgi:hypothetical protein